MRLVSNWMELSASEGVRRLDDFSWEVDTGDPNGHGQLTLDQHIGQENADGRCGVDDGSS